MKLQLADAAALEALGARLAPVLDNAIVYLQGELGAGKTTLARGILRGMGYNDKVRSPTYTLVEPYAVDQGMVYHLDLYRLADAEELEWLGLRDMLAEQAMLLVEWPERGGGVLPEADLVVQIAPSGGGRSVDIVALTERGRQILSRPMLDDLVR
ncbi:MAG: tRNA (adenosine(37)-N6)-threonylcarbamoyltransferase complex ATPase subunit type 1 TsaE [Gammaproteobacteria bacterium]|nr:tRNA (adenosine(37)-N6)-threonylcarbamoyltransferase complex ATPase subunit type 1 TsaE [Gammaproteobacteria bacterium]